MKDNSRIKNIVASNSADNINITSGYINMDPHNINPSMVQPAGTVSSSQFNQPYSTYKDVFTGLKYNEDEFQADLKDYVESTYGQHYVGKNSVQVFDLIISNDDMEEYARWSAVKYLVRYGKKKGYAKTDLLKAAHYIMLLHEATKEYKDAK